MSSAFWKRYVKSNNLWKKHSGIGLFFGSSSNKRDSRGGLFPQQQQQRETHLQKGSNILETEELRHLGSLRDVVLVDGARAKFVQQKAEQNAVAKETRQVGDGRLRRSYLPNGGRDQRSVVTNQSITLCNYDRYGGLWAISDPHRPWDREEINCRGLWGEFQPTLDETKQFVS